MLNQLENQAIEIEEIILCSKNHLIFMQGFTDLILPNTSFSNQWQKPRGKDIVVQGDVPLL